MLLPPISCVSETNCPGTNLQSHSSASNSKCRVLGAISRDETRRAFNAQPLGRDRPESGGVRNVHPAEARHGSKRRVPGPGIPRVSEDPFASGSPGSGNKEAQ